MKVKGMPQKDLMVFTPPIPPGAANTAATAANAAPRNSFRETGTSVLSPAPSIDMLASVTVWNHTEQPGAANQQKTIGRDDHGGHYRQGFLRQLSGDSGRRRALRRGG